MFETIVGTPDPEDDRTPEQKYAEHEQQIRRDAAVEKRRGQELRARFQTEPEETAGRFNPALWHQPLDVAGEPTGVELTGRDLRSRRQKLERVIDEAQSATAREDENGE